MKWPASERNRPQELPVLDTRAIAALRALQWEEGPDLVGDMARLFLEDAGQRLSDLETALARPDAARVWAIAHALKDGALVIGAVRLGRVCAELEAAACAAGSGEAHFWASRIAAELELLRGPLLAQINRG